MHKPSAGAPLPTEKKPAKYDAFSDVSVAHVALLAGFDPEEEKEQRAALGRLLRSGQPLSQEIRDVLASLFDRSVNGRKLEFKQARRGRNRRDTVVLGWQVASYVEILRRHEPPLSMKEIVWKATELYGLQKSRVKAFWKKYRSEITDEPN